MQCNAASEEQSSAGRGVKPSGLVKILAASVNATFASVSFSVAERARGG